MKSSDYAGLEKDYDFKRSYFNNTLWWKTLSVLPPVLLLFVGLAGIIYLFKSGMPVSLYIIPYLLLFTIGTIWLKAAKRHILKVSIAVEGAFHICLAAPIGDKDEYIYAALVNDIRRHDKYYITNLAKNMSLHKLPFEHDVSFKKEAVLIHNRENDIDIYVKAYKKKAVTRRNAGWSLGEGYFPVLYIDNKNIPVIKRKDLVQGQSSSVRR
jgi:hypothetical protein